MGRELVFCRHIPNATDATDQAIGPMSFPGRIISIRCNARALASSGGSPALDVEITPDGTAVGSGTSVLSSTIKLEDTHATQTLTSDATAPSNNDTVSVGSAVYTFKTTLSVGPAVPFEVLIGADAAAALDNLKSAINATAGAGTTYGTGTTANTDVTATTNTDTTQVVEAIVSGTAGDAIAVAENSTHLSWGAATLAGGLGFNPATNFTATLNAVRKFIRGDRIGLNFSGTLTSLADLEVFVTVRAAGTFT